MGEIDGSPESFWLVVLGHKTMCAIRVLVVEDDHDVAELVQLALEPAYECLVARNGLEGTQMALEGEPDLIISDVMMPVLDGHELIRRLRRERALEHVPVVFLSALGSRDKIKQAYDLGATLYLTKPIDPSRLRRNIDLFVKDNHVQSSRKRRSVADVQKAFTGENTGASFAADEETTRRRAARAASSSPAAAAEANEFWTSMATPKPYRPAAPKGTDSDEDTSKRIVKPDSKIPAAVRPGHVPAGPAKVRVLVVEDDRDSSEMMVTALLEQQYEVMSALDGMEAIERAARYLPDIFVIDGMLPRMTGYQLVGMLKKNLTFQKTPIIFVSGKASVRDRQYVEKLGVKHFLAKPFAVEQLLKMLDQVKAEPGFHIHQSRASHKQAQLESLRDFEMHRADSPRSGVTPRPAGAAGRKREIK